MLAVVSRRHWMSLAQGVMLTLLPYNPQVIDAVNELIDELDNIQGSITTQGVEHIHANEVRACAIAMVPALVGRRGTPLVTASCANIPGHP